MSGKKPSDVDTAMEVIGLLREENSLFRENFEKLRGAYSQLHEQHTKLQQEFIALSQAKNATDANYDAIVNELRVELETKVKELDELRPYVKTPRDLELYKIQVAQEIEVPLQSELNQVREEAEMSRRQASDLHGKLALVKTELDQRKESYDKQLTESHDHYEGLLKELTEKLKNMQGMLDDKRERNQVRFMERELNKIQLRYKQLEQENEDFRKEKSSLLVSKENLVRELNAAKVEGSRGIHSLEAEKDSLSRRFQALEAAMANANVQQEKLHQQNLALQRETILHKKEADESVEKAKYELSKMRTQLLDKQNNWDADRHELATENDTMRSSLSSLTAEHQKTLRNLYEATAQLENATRGGAGAAGGNLASGTATATAFENLLNRLSTSFNESGIGGGGGGSPIDSRRQESEALSGRVRTLQAHVQQLKDQNKRLDESLTDSKSSLERKERVVGEMKAELDEARKDSKTAEEEVLVERKNAEKMSARLRVMQDELSTLVRDSDADKKDALLLAKKWKKAHQKESRKTEAAIKKYDRLKRRFQDKLKSMVDSLKQEKIKLRRMAKLAGHQKRLLQSLDVSGLDAEPSGKRSTDAVLYVDGDRDGLGKGVGLELEAGAGGLGGGNAKPLDDMEDSLKLLLQDGERKQKEIRNLVDRIDVLSEDAMS